MATPGADGLQAVSLRVQAGEAVAVLGEQGRLPALTELLTGLRRPSRGRITVFGHDPRSPQARRHLTTTPATAGIPESLYVHEVFDLVRRHFADPVPVIDLADRFEITAQLSRPVAALRPAEERRVGLALAFLGRPRIVVLNEPTAGLDRQERVRVWSLLCQAARGRVTLLVTTSDLSEATTLADRVLLLRDGRVGFDGSREQVRRHIGVRQVTFRTNAPERVAQLAPALRVLRAGPGMVRVDTADVDLLLEDLAVHQITAHDVRIRSISLQDAASVLTARVSA